MAPPRFPRKTPEVHRWATDRFGDRHFSFMRMKLRYPALGALEFFLRLIGVLVGVLSRDLGPVVIVAYYSP